MILEKQASKSFFLATLYHKETLTTPIQGGNVTTKLEFYSI